MNSNPDSEIIKNQKYRHGTALSKKVWELKEKGIDHNITWSIIEKSRAYEGDHGIATFVYRKSSNSIYFHQAT